MLTKTPQNKYPTITLELGDQKTTLELGTLILRLSDLGLRNFQLTNKAKTCNNSQLFGELCKFLNTKNPELLQYINWTLTYSLGNNYNGGIRTMELFQEYCDNIQSLCKSCKLRLQPSILIVSGSTQRKVNSLTILEEQKVNANLFLKDKKNSNQFGVAFNPFLSDQNLDMEKTRLYKKLKTGKVNTVYIQIGTNLELLQSGLEYIRSINTSVKIIICVLLPSQNLLNTWNFRPWRGVFLGSEFLGDLKTALDISNNVIQFCNHNNLEILLTVMDWKHFFDQNQFFELELKNNDS